MPIPRYSEGDRTKEAGLTVHTLIVANDKVCVFLLEDGSIAWEASDEFDTPPLSARMHAAMQHFDSLCTLANTTLEERYRKAALVRLGKALFRALNDLTKTDIAAFFVDAEAFITGRIERKARFQYVMAVFWTMLLALVCMTVVFVATRYWWPFRDLQLLSAGAIGGIIGAGLSVLSRSRQVAVDPDESKPALLMHGVIRVIVGFFSGVILVLASRADIFLASIKDSAVNLLVFSIGAGFSERFIPDIMDRIRPTSQKPPGKDQGQPAPAQAKTGLPAIAPNTQRQDTAAAAPSTATALPAGKNNTTSYN